MLTESGFPDRVVLMRTSLLVGASTLALGFAGGWLLKPAGTPPNSTFRHLEPAPWESEPVSVLESATSSASGTASAPPPGGTASITNLESFLALFGHQHSIAQQASAYQSLRRLGSAQLGELAKALVEHPNDSRAQQGRGTLFERWAEVDPEALLAFARQANHPQIKHHATTSAIKALASKDFGRARTLVESLENQELRDDAYRYLLGTGAESDPVGMLTLLKDLSNPRHHYSYRQVFETWSRTNPQQAANHLPQVPQGEARNHAISGLARAWAEKDATAAFQWAQSMENHSERQTALREILARSTQEEGQTLLADASLSDADRTTAMESLARTALWSDLDGTLQWIETLPKQQRQRVISDQFHTIVSRDPERAKELLMANLNGRLANYADNLATQWARKDVAAAQQWIDELPAGEMRRDAQRGLINAMAEKDPSSAAAYLENEGLNEANRYSANAVVSHWFRQDRQAAIDWVARQADSELHRQLVDIWAQEDPEAASAYALEIPDENARQFALVNIMHRWAQQDPESAQGVLDQLDGETRARAGARLIISLAGQDVDSAVRVLEEELGSTRDASEQRQYAEAAQRIADQWAEYDTEGAATWAASLQHPHAQEQAVQRVASEWALYDPRATSEWIAGLAPGAPRDGAISSLVSRIQQDDPEGAFAWANSMSDDGQRQSRLQSIVQNWKQSDPDAAFNALQSANLSNEAYQRLARQFDQ